MTRERDESPVVTGSRPGEYHGGRIPLEQFCPVVTRSRTHYSIESRGGRIPAEESHGGLL